MNKHTGRQVGSWSAAILAIIVVSLVPVVWIISLSFKDPSTIGDGNFFPSKWSTINYSGIFKQGIFTDALRNSIGIALISTVIAVVIASFAAYAIARLEFPGKRVLLAASLGIAMFPAISLVGPLYNLWRNIGLYDTWPGLILPYMTFALPLSIYTLWAFFREIPWELEQAAQVDGATPFQAFFRVIAPLAAPGIFTTGILVFIFCWNDFVADLDVSGPDRSSGNRHLPGRLSVHRTDRVDRRRRRDRDHPDGDHRAVVPAADRVRTHRRSRQGLMAANGNTPGFERPPAPPGYVLGRSNTTPVLLLPASAPGTPGDRSRSGRTPIDDH
jgi:multiple sugar transport system permease protein